MSGRDPRQEAASIARGARRRVELERAAGTGELLADSARAAGRRARPAAVAVDSAAADPGATVTLRPAVEAEAGPPREPLDLFGEAKPAAGRAGVGQAAVPAAVPLEPGGWSEREPIAAASGAVLDEVAAEARACVRCGLCRTRENAVPGVGSARSGIVFVGEAPGAEEDRQGEPFVGRAGELLTRIIKAMDDARLIPGVPLTRDTVYICNVLKCRPPENRNPLPHEVESCSPYLRRQLEALRPRVICCLGKFAAELLVGVKGTIAALRGRTYRYRGAKLIVTYHPAACLRNPSLKRPVWEDMQLVAREYQAD